MANLFRCGKSGLKLITGSAAVPVYPSQITINVQGKISSVFVSSNADGIGGAYSSGGIRVNGQLFVSSGYGLFSITDNSFNIGSVSATETAYLYYWCLVEQ